MPDDHSLDPRGSPEAPHNSPGQKPAPNEGGDSSYGPTLSFGITVAVTVAIIGAAVSLIFGTFVTARPIPAPASQEAMKRHRVVQSSSKVTFNPPSLSDAPKDMQDAVNRGHKILMDTRTELPAYVGGKLDCKNCHFEAGRIRKTLSLVGVAAVYPRYGRSEGGAIDLVEQTNRCFQRSLNGKPLPPDGKEMRAIMAYYHWISRGIPIYADIPWLGLKDLQNEHEPDASKGKTLFGDKCGSCHGQDGQGTQIAPPLWGDGSFNDGASMAQLRTFAAFGHAFMPKGSPDLDVDQALDIAAYVTSQPRPHFQGEGASGSPSTSAQKSGPPVSASTSPAVSTTSSSTGKSSDPNAPLQSSR